MARSYFENLRVYRIQQLQLLDELSPRLNAYLKSIGRHRDQPVLNSVLPTDN